MEGSNAHSLHFASSLHHTRPDSLSSVGCVCVVHFFDIKQSTRHSALNFQVSQPFNLQRHRHMGGGNNSKIRTNGCYGCRGCSDAKSNVTVEM